MTSATLEEILNSPHAPADTSWVKTTEVRAPRRRMRGIRITAVPSWPLLSQFGGGAAVLGGVFLLWGVAVTLIVGGVVAVALGTLREGGKI
jgi:hypothetical protein